MNELPIHKGSFRRRKNYQFQMKIRFLIYGILGLFLILITLKSLFFNKNNYNVDKDKNLSSISSRLYYQGSGEFIEPYFLIPNGKIQIKDLKLLQASSSDLKEKIYQDNLENSENSEILKIFNSYENNYDKNKINKEDSNIDLKISFNSPSALLFRSFYDDLFYMLKKCAPKIDSLSLYPRGDAKKNYQFNGNAVDDWLLISDVQQEVLKKQHSVYISNVISEFPDGLYNGDGIVITLLTESDYPSLVIISRILRNRGSILPIEIIIPNIDFYNENICNNILSPLNATCLILPQVLGYRNLEPFADDLTSSETLLAPLAILGSSFESVLFLSLKTIPTINVDNLFNSNPFTTFGLILWPDLWLSTTHSSYYKIANLQLPPFLKGSENDIYRNLKQNSKSKSKQDSFSQEKISIPKFSTESGQLMINKRTHLKSLLLSIYYNIYGKDFYYPLFSQGFTDITDAGKDTYIPAALALNESFYFVGNSLCPLGYNMSDKGFAFTADGNADPHQDYIYFTAPRSPYESKSDDENAFSGDSSSDLKQMNLHNSQDKNSASHQLKSSFIPDISFIHFVSRKIDPMDYILNRESYLFVDYLDMTIPEKPVERKIFTRTLGSTSKIRSFMRDRSTDIEGLIWEMFNTIACSPDADLFPSWQGFNKESICKLVTIYQKFLSLTVISSDESSSKQDVDLMLNKDITQSSNQINLNEDEAARRDFVRSQARLRAGGDTLYPPLPAAHQSLDNSMQQNKKNTIKDIYQQTDSKEFGNAKNEWNYETNIKDDSDKTNQDYLDFIKNINEKNMIKKDIHESNSKFEKDINNFIYGDQGKNSKNSLEDDINRNAMSNHIDNLIKNGLKNEADIKRALENSEGTLKEKVPEKTEIEKQIERLMLNNLENMNGKFEQDIKKNDPVNKKSFENSANNNYRNKEIEDIIINKKIEEAIKKEIEKTNDNKEVEGKSNYKKIEIMNKKEGQVSKDKEIDRNTKHGIDNSLYQKELKDSQKLILDEIQGKLKKKINRDTEREKILKEHKLDIDYDSEKVKGNKIAMKHDNKKKMK